MRGSSSFIDSFELNVQVPTQRTLWLTAAQQTDFRSLTRCPYRSQTSTQLHLLPTPPSFVELQLMIQSHQSSYAYNCIPSHLLHSQKTQGKTTQAISMRWQHRTPTSAVDFSLLCRALALVEVLVAHLGGHGDALPGGLGNVLRHPEPSRDDVANQRHLCGLQLHELFRRLLVSFFSTSSSLLPQNNFRRV